MESLEPMYRAWIEQYGTASKTPEIIESSYQYSPIDGVVFGGTVDAIQGDTLIDWKSSSKSKSSLSDYRMQMYCYYFIINSKRKMIEKMTEEECKAYYLSNYS